MDRRTALCKQDSATRHPPVRSSAAALRRVSVQPTFYKKELPYPAIEFSSPKGKTLFREALEGGTLEGFFRVIEQFQTQCETAFCGLATLSIILNALAIDPGRLWKGPWRWFDESLLDCCEPLEVVREKGITLPKFACLARCNGAKARLIYASDVTLEQVRADIQRYARGEDSVQIAAAYSRPALGQTGTGHFSPIGGYHAPSDRVLILDVARFKYPPHWVPLKTFYEAMRATDPETNRSRGYVVLSAREARPGCLFTVSCQAPTWYGMARYTSAQFGTAAWGAGLRPPAEKWPPGAPGVVAAFIAGLSRDACQFVSAHEVTDQNEAAAAQLIEDIRACEMYDFVLAATGDLTEQDPCPSSSAAQDACDAAVGVQVVMTLVCLLVPPATWARAAPLVLSEGAEEAAAALSRASDVQSLVGLAVAEVRHLRGQVAELVCTDERCASGHVCTGENCC